MIADAKLAPVNTVHRAFKIRVYPTQDQKRLFARTEGACRFVYNRSLEHIKASYEAKKAGFVERADTPIDFSRVVTQWKKQPETAWLSEVPSGPLGATLRAQDEAFKRFFKGVARHPKPHRRRMACSIQSSLDPRHKDKAAAWADQKILFPGFGIIKVAQPERIPMEQPKMLTLSRDSCGRYFIAFQVSVTLEWMPASVNDRIVGVDLGVKTLAVFSTGESRQVHQAERKRRRRLKHLQRCLSRKVGSRKGEKKSRRWIRQRQQINRLECRISDGRRDTQHKLTTHLAKNYGVICLEDLHVKGMMTSAKGTPEAPGSNVAQKAGLNRGLSNAGFGEIRRQIEYKSVSMGGIVLFADRFAPTSRTCSACGSYQKEFSLKIRKWICPTCGAVHDRDENAAKNIAAFATGSYPGSYGGETPDVMRVEGQIHPTPKGAIPRICQGPDEARTESLKSSKIMPTKAWKPRAE
ncbi:MAG: transposase [Verrucomicrobia bacterium]|nr:transposase [Verrucomicrobiota bacterium]